MLICFLVKTSHINEHGVYSLDIWMDDDSSQYIITIIIIVVVSAEIVRLVDSRINTVRYLRNLQYNGISN